MRGVILVASLALVGTWGNGAGVAQAPQSEDASVASDGSATPRDGVTGARAQARSGRERPGLVELARDPIERFTLANGLRVVLQPDARQVRVAGAIAYDVGHRDDPPGYRGLAHLVEHLTFRGSRHLADGQALTSLLEVGGTANGMTTMDHTIYIASLPARHLARFLWIESERMAFTLEAMQQAAFEIERDVVTNEWRERSGGGARIVEFIYASLFPASHPYRRAAEWEEDVEDISLDHARWFFQAHYRPDNATLALVGAFDTARVKQLIAQYFGPIKAPHPHPPRQAAPLISVKGRKRLVVDIQVGRARTELHWSRPCRDLRCQAGLRLLTWALVEKNHGLIPRALAAAGLAGDAFASTHFYGEQAMITVGVRFAGDQPDEQAFAPMRRAIMSLGAEGLDGQTLASAKYGLATSMLQQDESLEERAIALAQREHGALTQLEAAMALSPSDLMALTAEFMGDEGCLELMVRRTRGSVPEGVLSDSTGTLIPTAAGTNAPTRGLR